MRLQVTVNLRDDGFCSRWGELSGTESELLAGKRCGRGCGPLSYSGFWEDQAALGSLKGGVAAFEVPVSRPLRCSSFSEPHWVIAARVC